MGSPAGPGRARRLLPALAAWGLFGALLPPGRALACSCAPLQPPSESLASSAAVFTGRVVALELDDAEQVERAVLKVKAVWKGVATTRVAVSTSFPCCLCGFPLELGKDYLLYAHGGDDGGLWTTACSRSAPLGKAGGDVAALGPPLELPLRDEPAPGRPRR